MLVALLAPELCYTMSHAGLENSLEDVIKAMRRRDMLQRADKMIAHSVGRVLLALATTVADKHEGCKSVSCSAVMHLDPCKVAVPAWAQNVGTENVYLRCFVHL